VTGSPVELTGRWNGGTTSVLRSLAKCSHHGSHPKTSETAHAGSHSRALTRETGERRKQCLKDITLSFRIGISSDIFPHFQDPSRQDQTTQPAQRPPQLRLSRGRFPVIRLSVPLRAPSRQSSSGHSIGTQLSFRIRAMHAADLSVFGTGVVFAL
jgi:hypothetical protein